MLEQIRSLLASNDPATLVGSAAVVVFFLVLSWRKFFPASWNWLEMRIPLIDRIQSDAIWTFVWKAVQSIPGAAFGAVMAALASGGDVKKTLLGALAGPVASIGHEVLKAYKGKTSKPGNRSLPPPPLAAAIIGAALGLAAAFALPGCSLFGPGGSVWPAVENCAPSPQSLIQRVTVILLAGGDYKAALLELAKTETKEAIVCAVQAATAELRSKVSASPASAEAVGRGNAFLAETSNK